MKSLPDIIKELRHKQIDIIKIDIERFNIYTSRNRSDIN